MKRWFVIGALGAYCLFMALRAHADISLSIGWGAAPLQTGLTGYRLYGWLCGQPQKLIATVPAAQRQYAFNSSTIVPGSYCYRVAPLYGAVEILWTPYLAAGVGPGVFPMPPANVTAK